MKNMEKSELHLHIGGSWPLKYLEEIAQPQEFADLCAMLDKIQDVVDYHDAFQVFGLIGKIVNSEERIEKGVTALCKDLAQDNVTYAELRTGLKDFGHGLEGYLTAVLKGMSEGTRETPLKAGLILSLRRDTNLSISEQTIDLAIKYRNKGVIGIDVSGDSIQGDGSAIFAALIRAKENGLPITLHIGESEKETPEQQMKELYTIQPTRIGHGVHLCREAKEWVKENKTLVELCLTSALKVGMIQNRQDHPALQLISEGHPVAICTDDPLIFKTTLSKEYEEVAAILGLTAEEMHSLQAQTHPYAFTSQE